MKACPCCEASIPDHARHCPHCRKEQARRGWVLQALLVGLVFGAATLWLLNVV